MSITILRHCGKKLCFNLREAWCWRSESPAVFDCNDPSHQLLRSHHTTITTNHNMQKEIPAAQQYPSHPYQTPAKNTMSTPSNKEGGADHKKDSEKTRS